MSNLWYYGLSKEEYEKCTPYIKENTNSICRMAIIVGTIFMPVLFALSFILKEASVFRMVYLAFSIVMLVAFFVHNKIKDRYVVLQIYIITLIYYAFGFSVSILWADDKSTIFPLLFVLIPMLFTDKLFRMIILNFATLIAFIVAVIFFKDSSIWFPEIYNGVALFFLSVIAHWMMNQNRCQGHLLRVKNEEMKKELKYLSENDVLTRLANRRMLYEIISQIEEGKADAPYGVMLMDIDKFKNYNDTYGHTAGDRCLKSFGDMLLNIQTTHNIRFFRYGGEEFVAFYWCKTKEELADMAENIRKTTNLIDLDTAPITVSIGCVFCDSTNLDYEKWIERADQAAYNAKKHGRNCVVVW